MSRALLALAVAAVGCSHHAATVEAIPPSLAFHAVAPGPWIRPQVDRIDDTTPTPPLGKLVRVWLTPGGMAYVFDLDGHVATASIHGAHVLPFSEPVRALGVPNDSGWTGVMAVLASGAVEHLVGHERRRYDLGRAMTALWEGCYQAAPGEPLGCYAIDTPRLQLRSAFGPPSPAELAVLQRVSMRQLLQWRRAGGAEALGALQIDGSVVMHDARSAASPPEHVCGVLADHTVACWGRSVFGELGDGQHSATPRYVRVPGLTDIVEVATGDTHSCARDRAGHVACWGDASRHAFPVSGGASTLPACPVDRAATDRLMAGRRARAHEDADACERRECAPGTLDCHLGCVYHEPPEELVYDHRTPCAERGSGGDPVTIVDHPRLLPGIDDAVSLAAGGLATCVVHATGRLQCWDGALGGWSL